MEGKSEEVAEKTDNPAKSGSDTSMTKDDSIHVCEITKHKNMLLLSALYYVCGEEWKEPPDWRKVAGAIQELNIPLYGEGFTTEVCEQMYKLMVENGVELGAEHVRLVIKPPERLTDSQKRLWMLAVLSNDINEVAQLREKQIEHAYKTQLRVMEMAESSGVISQEIFEKEFALPFAEDHPGDDPEYSVEYEDLEANVVANELRQLELLEEILGMKDVLPLARYCYEACKYAVNNYESLMKRRCKEKPLSVIPEPPVQKNKDDLNAPFVFIDSPKDETLKLLSPIKPVQPQTQTIRSEASEKQVEEGSTSKQSPKPSTPAKESEKMASKSRASTRKSVGTKRKGSKRTSSRLASPEPSGPAQNDDDDSISKRTRRRGGSSGSDTSVPQLPAIRRRRVATPTIPVDKEFPKVATGNSKPDVVSVEGSENKTFETPRTTPKSPEMKTPELDDKVNKEARPKTLKTYSIKPPSPLSHVDSKK